MNKSNKMNELKKFKDDFFEQYANDMNAMSYICEIFIEIFANKIKEADKTVDEEEEKKHYLGLMSKIMYDKHTMGHGMREGRQHAFEAHDSLMTTIAQSLEIINDDEEVVIRHMKEHTSMKVYGKKENEFGMDIDMKQSAMA